MPAGRIGQLAQLELAHQLRREQEHLHWSLARRDAASGEAVDWAARIAAKHAAVDRLAEVGELLRRLEKGEPGD